MAWVVASSPGAQGQQYDVYMLLRWQSRLILLLALPIAGADLVIETGFWYSREPRIPLWSFGICAFFALVVLLMRAGTPAAAAAGFAITSSLIFSTAPLPFMPLRTAFTPAFGVFALAYAATRFGYSGKLRLGTAEPRSGRSAPQVAANLGAAMLFALPFFQFLLINSNLIGPHLYSATALIPALIFAPALAALAEAAADTVSSEIGQSLTIAFNQKFGTRPRLITTLRIAQPGTVQSRSWAPSPESSPPSSLPSQEPGPSAAESPSCSSAPPAPSSASSLTAFSAQLWSARAGSTMTL